MESKTTQEVDAQIKLIRNREYPEGEYGAWMASIYVNGELERTMIMGFSRDEALSQAETIWQSIRANYTGEPDPEPEWVKLS